METTSVWGGRSLSDRSADRRDALLAAGEKLLGEGGAAALTMRAVMREANLSPRYFYESFASREELLIAVYDKTEADMFARVASTIDLDLDVKSAVRVAIQALRDFLAEDPRRGRILLREPLADDALREHRAGRVPTFTRALAPMFGRLSDTADADNSRWTLLSTALSGALVSMYLDYIDGRLDVDPETMVDTAVELVFAIVGINDL